MSNRPEKNGRRPAPRILIVTPLDYDGYKNTEHGMTYGLTSHGADVTLLYKKMNRSPRLLHMLRDTVLLRTRRREEPSVTMISVDPLFNYYAGFRVQTETTARHEGRRSLKTYLVRALSPLSVLRDVFFLPSFLCAAAMHLRGPYDVIVGCGPWGSLAAWVLCRTGVGRRFVYEDRDYEPGLMPDRLRTWYTAQLEVFLLKQADRVVSIGGRLVKLRSSQTQRQPALIPTGVYCDRFAPRQPRLRTGHTLIYFGNLISWSGLEIAIQALARLIPKFPDAKLIIAGDGLPGYRQSLVALCESLSVTNHVEFTGSVSHEVLPSLLERADVSLANSQPVEYRKYACPLKVIESMAAGLPTVATQDTEAADLVEEYGFGFAVPFDAAALADALEAYWSDPQRAVRYCEQARHHAPSFDWKFLMERQLEIMLGEESAAPGRKPSADAGKGEPLVSVS